MGTFRRRRRHGGSRTPRGGYRTRLSEIVFPGVPSPLNLFIVVESREILEIDAPGPIERRPQQADIVDPAHGEHARQVDPRQRQRARARAGGKDKRAVVDGTPVGEHDAAPGQVERRHQRPNVYRHILIAPKAFRPQQKRIRPGRLGEKFFRQRRALIGQVWLVADDANAAAKSALAQAAGELRRSLFEQTAGMFPELVTRSDLKVFLPPIGGMTLYFVGDVAQLGKPETRVACRVHDECNGSDVFGSDICTCRPYLAHGIEIAIQMAQAGGVGLVVYNRKEGRALGEVTKFLVYNARKRQKGGDRPDGYFKRTECVAGVQDMRFQELMPDVLHWLGVTRIHRFASMSDMKCDALVRQGIQIDERVPLPDGMIPPDARVEIEAKIAAGYFAGDRPRGDLAGTIGRGLHE